MVVACQSRGYPGEHDREMYTRRNQVERLFGCLKGFQRVFSHFEKPDAMFLGFLRCVLVADRQLGLFLQALVRDPGPSTGAWVGHGFGATVCYLDCLHIRVEPVR